MTDLFFQTKEPDTDDDGTGIVAPTDEDPAEEPVEGEESDLKEDGITDDEDELE